jgi:Raf kinase inhibitor-like YbhB/YbcL family protein
MADVQFTDVPLNESGSIPPEYTCDGEDVSPPLAWAAPPDAAESLVLIVDDPDAPVPDSFTHWVLFNLSTEVTALPRDYHAGDPRLEADALDPKEGINDFGDVQYGGPVRRSVKSTAMSSCSRPSTQRSILRTAPIRMRGGQRLTDTWWGRPNSWAPTSVDEPGGR